MKSNEILARYKYLYPLHQWTSATYSRAHGKIADTEIGISTITKGEMYAGSAKSINPQHSRAVQDAFFIRFVSLPFDEPAADIFGRVRAALEVAGTPIGPYDMQIAAVALANNLIVVTHNTREFGRIAGLALEEWEL